MKKNKKVLSGLLALSLAVSLLTACKSSPASAPEVQTSAADSSAAAQTQAETEADSRQESEVEQQSQGVYEVGDKMDDFTVTTYDGKTVSLYELLEEKDMVLLNFFATWCGPCASEFPFMAESYEQHKDNVEVLVLSTETTDSDEVLSAYAEKHGLPFLMAQDVEQVGARLPFNTIPVSVVVDRFGTICLMESGAQSSTKIFDNVFEFFAGDDYKESQILPGMGTVKPDVQPETPETLASVLDSDLAFKNSQDIFTWPMIAGEKDGRSVLIASNQSHPGNKAEIEMDFQSKEGDVFVVEFKLKNEFLSDMMQIFMDGENVKTFLADSDWRSYAFPIEEPGEHHVTISYMNGGDDSDEEALYIDRIVLVSGDDAKKALDQNPKYPVSDKTEFSVCAPDGQPAKEVFVFDKANPADNLEVLLLPSETAEISFQLDASVDPESAYVSDGETFISIVSQCLEGDEYRYRYSIRQDAKMNRFAGVDDEEQLFSTYLFSSEESLDKFVELFNNISDDEEFAWEYAEAFTFSSDVGETKAAEAKAAEAKVEGTDPVYIITYVDQNGDPVSGVMCQLCDDDTCQIIVSDENGVCEVPVTSAECTVHTLKIPEEYEGDLITTTTLPFDSGEMTVTLKKK